MSIVIPPPPPTGRQPVGPEDDGQPRRNSPLQVLVISGFFLALFAMIGLLVLPLYETRIQEARKNFAATVAFIAVMRRSALVSEAAGASEQESGEKAVADLAEGNLGSGGPPDPPDGRKRLWEFEPPCKLKVNVAWELPLLMGAIVAPETNICTAAFYACAGAIILNCRADQSWDCVNDAFDKKCAAWRGAKEE